MTMMDQMHEMNHGEYDIFLKQMSDVECDDVVTAGGWDTCKWGNLGGLPRPLSSEVRHRAVWCFDTSCCQNAHCHCAQKRQYQIARGHIPETQYRPKNVNYSSRNPWAQRKKCPVRRERDRWVGQVAPVAWRTVKISCSAKCSWNRGCFMYKHSV